MARMRGLRIATGRTGSGRTAEQVCRALRRAARRTDRCVHNQTGHAGHNGADDVANEAEQIGAAAAARMRLRIGRRGVRVLLLGARLADRRLRAGEEVLQEDLRLQRQIVVIGVLCDANMGSIECFDRKFCE